MIDKAFIEEYPLFKKITYSDNTFFHLDNWKTTPINMHCHECKSVQTFNTTRDLKNIKGKYYHLASDNVLHLLYVCQSCRSFERNFYIYCNSDGNEFYKVGQHPEWEIKMDKNLEKILNKHAKTFRKGLVCESQGYGIGAFAYFRRITEEIIDELLDSITDLIEEENKDKYLEALKKTKETRVTQDKINLIKDLLPSTLKPNGRNPLGILHSELSEGLHSLDDEQCLESATHVKSILIFLVNQILHMKETSKSFTDSMKNLLDKKNK